MKLEKLVSLPKRLVVLSIRTYQKTRLFRAPSCRFYPTCSQYMAGCVEEHGFFKGSFLTLIRLAKCHPLHPGGVDEVPAEFKVLTRVAQSACIAGFSHRKHKR
jgi:putative membrane protein insertion efficiency factor